jgi:hypothetical protein
MVTFYRMNDQYVEITGLKDTITDAFVNTATVTATLYNRNGVAMENFTDISLDYLAASNGNYRGFISEAFNAAVGSDYTLVLEVVSGSNNLRAEYDAEVTVR